MQYYKGLDGLKGIAILGVVMVHWGEYLHTSNNTLNTLVTAGAKGVELFLIITTFLACSSYSKWKSIGNEGGDSVGLRNA